jgi:soluble lytic murein transglycosylase-like protein
MDVKIPVYLLEEQADAIPENSALSDKKEKAEHPFSTIISRASDQYEIDSALIKAIIMAESGYDPKAISKKGAMGLMQLMPQTAEALGVKDCFNPEHNIIGGVRYFRQLMNQFEGDIKLALAAYNAGGSKVRKYQGVPPYRATQYYIKKVFEYYQNYKNQMEEEMSRV